MPLKYQQQLEISIPFRPKRYSVFSSIRTRTRLPFIVSVRQQPSLSIRQLYSSSRQVSFEEIRQEFMPVMLLIREDYDAVGLRTFSSLQSLSRSAISRLMPSLIWFQNMRGSILEQTSTMLFSIFLILGFIWLLMVFLSYSFIPKMLSSCFCRISCKESHFASMLSILSYSLELRRSYLIFLSMQAKMSSFRKVSALLLFRGASRGYLILEESLRLIYSICILLSLTSRLRASSWYITSFTNLELEVSLPRFTLILEFNPWKEFLRSTPQSPYALDFFVPVILPISLTNVSNFSSFSLLKTWKLLANLVTDSCRWLVSSLNAQKFSYFFLSAVLICVTSSSKALSYFTPCSFNTSDTFEQISSLTLSISLSIIFSTFSWVLTSDPLKYSSLLSLPNRFLLELVLALLPEYPTTTSYSTGMSFFSFFFLISLANTPLCISRLVLQFLEDSAQQLSAIFLETWPFSLYPLLVLGNPLEFMSVKVSII